MHKDYIKLSGKNQMFLSGLTKNSSHLGGPNSFQSTEIINSDREECLDL